MSHLTKEIKRLERYVSRGDAEKALKGYERLQTRFPKDPVIRHRVGFLRDTLHRHAPEWQVRTYVISPRAIAEAHIIAQRYEAALELLEGLLEAQPEEQGLARRVAMVRSMRDGREDDGLEITASTHLMSPEMLIDAHLAGGDVGAALRLLKSLCQRRPNDQRLQARMRSLSQAWDADVNDPPSQSSLSNASVDKISVGPPPLPGHKADFAQAVDIAEVAEVDTGRPGPVDPMADLSGVFAHSPLPQNPAPARSEREQSNLDPNIDEDALLTETQVEVPPGLPTANRGPAAAAQFSETSAEFILGDEDDSPFAQHLAKSDGFALPPHSDELQDLYKTAQALIEEKPGQHAPRSTRQPTRRLRRPQAATPATPPSSSPSAAPPPAPRPAEDKPEAALSARQRAQKLDAGALLRRERTGQRRSLGSGLGSAQDLLGASPHRDLDEGHLLRSAQAPPANAASRFDIHEVLTDTGTDPRLKLPAPSILPHTLEAQAVALAIRERLGQGPEAERKEAAPRQKTPPAVASAASSAPQLQAPLTPAHAAPSGRETVRKSPRVATQTPPPRPALLSGNEDWAAMAQDFDEAETAANPGLYAALHRADRKPQPKPAAPTLDPTAFEDDDATLADDSTLANAAPASSKDPGEFTGGAATLEDIAGEDFEETIAGVDPRDDRGPHSGKK